MADESKSDANPFDMQTIRSLAALMSRHDLSEIDLRDGDKRLRVLRGARVQVAAASSPVAYAPGSPSPGPPPTPPAAEKSAPEKPTKNLLDIKSELVGTFYTRPNPDAEQYVKLGSRVTPNTVVGLIEAMKLYNDVLAGCTGVIVEALVNNEQPVEYDQVLFRVDPTA